MAAFAILLRPPSRIIVRVPALRCSPGVGKVTRLAWTVELSNNSFGGHGIVTNAGLGRSSGGIHGSRSRKAGRRRSPRADGNDSQDDTLRQRNGEGASDEDVVAKQSEMDSGHNKKIKDAKDSRKKLRRRASKLEEDRQNSTRSSELPVEEVAPVAVTVLTDPELFESEFQGNKEESNNEENEENGSQTLACEALKEISSRTGEAVITELDEVANGSARSQMDEDSWHSVRDDESNAREGIVTNVKELQATNADSDKESEDSTSRPLLATEKIVEIQNQVVEQVSHVAEQVAQIGHKVVDDVLPEKVVTQAGQVAGQVSQVAEVLVEQVAVPVVEQVTTAAVQVGEQVASLLLSEDKESESDDEFEAYKTSDLPEFRGIQGLENFTVLQENYGFLTMLYDSYIYILKKPVTEFALAMFAAPIVMSMLFTLLYLPQFHGLAFEETAKDFFQSSNSRGLELTWETVFQVFMFSVSLSTGLQPELAPLTPYTLVVANVNALVAQLIFVFLSGAVFARLSQPTQPIRCSSVALVCPPATKEARASRVFMTRYVLAGPQPCELVDVKVDLSYKYNTITRTGTYFRATQSLKLVRSEVAYMNHGMFVRHIIDQSSPLNRRTPEMLKKEDGIFTLSVVGLERSSMQPVFHAQHYSVSDDHVIWDAEFEDMILISKKNRRIVDHSRLSQWRPV